MNTPQKKFQSFADLAGLVPESEKVLNRKDAPKKGHDGKGKTVQVSIEKSGRKGKTVTIVAGLQHNPATMEEIAKELKKFCGAGGSVKDGKIEIQGDQRTRVPDKLREMNYNVG